MALYRLEFLVSSDVDVTSGTTTVTLNDGQDVSSVVPGTAVFINNQAVEAISGQNISPTQSTITLRYNWPFATVTSGRLVAFNTFEGLNTAITRLNDVINSIPDFTGATGQGFLYNDGTDTYTIKASTVFGESILNAADASSALSILQSPDYPSFAGQAGVLKKDALDVYSLVTSTAFGESLLSQVDASTARSTLGITDPSAFGQTLITQADAASARSTLGVVSATEVVEGLIRKSTSSEALNATDDNSSITPQKNKEFTDSFGLTTLKGALGATAADGHNINNGFYRISGTSVNVAGVTTGALINVQIQSGRSAKIIFDIVSRKLIAVYELNTAFTSEDIYTSADKVSANTLQSYTISTLPSASANPSAEIFISDLAGQAAPCYSDGANWRRHSDNTIAS